LSVSERTKQLDQSLKKHQAEIRSKDDTITALTTANDEATGKLEMVQTQASNLENELQAVQNENATLRLSVSERTKQLDQSLKKHQAEIRSKDDTITALTTANDEAAGKLEMVQAQASDVERELRLSLSNQAEEIERMNEGHRSAIEAKDSEHLKLKSVHDGTMAGLADSIPDLDVKVQLLWKDTPTPRWDEERRVFRKPPGPVPNGYAWDEKVGKWKKKLDQ